MAEFTQFRLGESSESVPVEGRDACLEAVLALIGQATHTVELVSRHLDPPLFDKSEVLELISAQVVDHPRFRLRAMVGDPSALSKQGHRLLGLAQRFSSYIELRAQARAYHDYGAAFLLVDRTGVLYRDSAHRFEGWINFNDPKRVTELSRLFDDMWELGQPDLNLRRIHV